MSLQHGYEQHTGLQCALPNALLIQAMSTPRRTRVASAELAVCRRKTLSGRSGSRMQHRSARLNRENLRSTPFCALPLQKGFGWRQVP